MFLPERLSEKEFITPKSDVRRCQSRLDRASPTSPPVVCTCGSGSSSSSSSGSSSSSSHVSSYSSPKEAHFISPKSGGRKYQRFFRCPGAAQQGSSVLQQQQHAAAALSLEEAGIAPGAAICFYRRDRTGSPGGGEAMVRRVYRALTEELVEDMRRLLRGEGPLGRVQLIKVQCSSSEQGSFYCVSIRVLTSYSGHFLASGWSGFRCDQLLTGHDKGGLAPPNHEAVPSP